jgi:hypothetical protein
VAIGEVKEEISAQGEREVHTCHLSYFSRMTGAETFGDLAEVEMQRRGVSQAKVVLLSLMGPTGFKASWICIGQMRCAFWIFRTQLNISTC